MPKEDIAQAPIESAPGREEAPVIADEVKSPDDVSSGRGEEATEQQEEAIAEDEKSLKSLYTKATQKLSDYEKELSAWNTLRNDPDFAKFIEAKMQQPQAQQQQQMQQLTPEQIEQMTPDQIMRYIVEVAKQEIKSEIDPVLNQFSQREETANKEAAKATIKEFFSKTPQAERFAPELGAIMKTQNIPLDKAWEQFSKKLEELTNTSKQEIYKEMDVKKNANLLMPGDTTKVKTAQTEKLSARQAMEKTLTELGM